MRRFIFCLTLIGILIPGMSWGQGPLSEAKHQLFKKLEARRKGLPVTKMLEGTLGSVTDSESVWIYIDNKRKYRSWTYKLSKNSLNIPRQEIRVYLRFVSPKRSISHGKKYNTWFKKKAAFDMRKVFSGRRVRVDYVYLPKIYRIKGMVWTGGTSINTWLVRQGLSFYLIENELSPDHDEFVEAERFAKTQKIGLWKPSLQKVK